MPARTRRRWRSRLASSAALVVSVLSAAFDVGPATRVVEAAGVTASRGELARAVVRELGPTVGQRLSRLTELVHRLAPGVRLM